MKPLSRIIAFTPLIVFSLLSRVLPHGYIGVAGLVAAVSALIALAISRPVWPPKILTACSLILFTVIAVLGFTLGKNDDRWLATWGGAGIGLGAAIFAAGVSRVAAAAIDGHTTRRLPETLLGLVVPVAIITYMLKFSKSYPDKVTHHAPAAGAPEGL